MQDEHILARKYADKWMVRALGVGLFKRKLRRREVEDTRQLLLTTIANPLARVRQHFLSAVLSKLQKKKKKAAVKLCAMCRHVQVLLVMCCKLGEVVCLTVVMPRRGIECKDWMQ